MSWGDPHLHVRGETVFVDDLPVPGETLHAAVLGSPLAHGRLLGIDAGAALRLPGVRRVLTAADIPGENQVGGILPDEPLLADGVVHHLGMPVALVLADDEASARRARAAIELELEALPVVTDPRVAAARGELLQPARVFASGDVDAAWADCAHVVAGRVDSGAQEHFYLETQCALALPVEGGRLLVHSSTQSPTGVQRQVARVLGLARQAVEVDVRRLGGAFGGKEDQAVHWAALAALGARLAGRPVRLRLDRADDMRMTGKRHPYSSDYRLGVDTDGRLLAYEVTFYQNGGSAADLSPAVLGRSLMHAAGSYAVPNLRATGLSCRTNLPPFTAFRGFGGPQAMFVMEAALDAAARACGLSRPELQRRNLLRPGSRFHYGMAAEDCRAERCWDEAAGRYDLAGRAAAVDAHNRAHADSKRGLAVMPVCFGISFTNTPMNQAGALVNVYADGSVGVSTGAVEMGQGVNAKIRSIVAGSFGIDAARVRLETTNTTRIPNTSPTAASTGADLNGRAAQLACERILERLRPFAAAELGGGDIGTGNWDELVAAAHRARIDLSAQAHYATPRLHFDRQTSRGRPFAYHVYGAAIVEVTLDCLRGTYRLDAVRLVHDLGRSLDERVDRGQIEGALAQGLGWMLLEELRYDASGRLLNDSAGRYKVPDLDFMPDAIDVATLEDADNPAAVLGSKAVGEPPLMYGIGAYFALRNALRAARPDLDLAHTVAPLTPERVLTLLTDEEKPA